MTKKLWWAALSLGLLACTEERQWQVAATGLDEALMGVGGSSESDVWAVGADVGQGPLVLHFDGTAWERKTTNTHGALWWVHAFSPTSAFFGGVRGTIVEWNGTDFVHHETPGLARQTVFGVWGSSATDVYAVGSGTSGRRGFLWHYDGAAWSEVALPNDVPLANGETPGLFKIWGTGANDIWAVGGDGLVLHKTSSGWAVVPNERKDTLFTVSGAGGRVYLCGGGVQSELLEGKGTSFTDVSPANVSLIQGLAGDPTDPEGAWATGEGGAVFHRTGGKWQQQNHGLTLDVESLHAAWVDPKGRVWAVGGRVISTLTKGALVRFAPKGAATYVQPEKPTPPAVTCPAAQIDPAEGKSIARRWDEQIIGAIRRDLPRPTVHARNLFHFSAAMWDAWATYHPSAQGAFSTEKQTATDLDAARQEAISYAAYRVLKHRYEKAIGGPVSMACFDAFMTKLGYAPDDATITGNTPRAVGNRIGQAIIDAAANDGANEANNYADTTGFVSMAPPLPVEAPSLPAENIDLWQPLDLAIAVTQNGIPQQAGVQKYIGAQWKDVTPFALSRPGPGLPYSAELPPTINAQSMDVVVEVLRRAHQLADTSTTIDISPGKYGNNSLGKNDGMGHPMNPVTGQAYASQVVPVADFGRVLAEFWADGPKSETPPGHWNVIANQAFEHPLFTRKWKGQGAELSPLEWDVRAYFALNGAVHDAAIAAWELKRVYLSSRPITHIRTSAARGQSSDPSKPSYDARGLPLIPDLIELVTAETAAPGGRHEGLQNAVGQIVVRTWKGEPGNLNQVSGITWLRGVEWVPYQRRDFVTPAFPGFISGHSTFSRAAAETLTLMTGSPYFPGGLGQATVKAGHSLTFEAGPSVDISLQFATYYDAADQAGQSRIWGGIHISPDDFAGRRTGSFVGTSAFAKADGYFPP